MHISVTRSNDIRSFEHNYCKEIDFKAKLVKLMRRLIDFSLTNNLFGIGQWRINSAAKKAIGVSLPTDQHLFHEPKNEIDYCLCFSWLWPLPRTNQKLKMRTFKSPLPIRDVAEWRHYGYFGGHGGYWRGRRSTEETSKREEAAAAVEVSADQEADKMYGRRYYGYYGFPYGSYHNILFFCS
ncbi:hypothetical protein DAPPUDRAFT_330135 [Daphnia pulex]|uniref:Uncharacterized protein n=1 Tax=Daphnia pulex TaxID=6669 RepID=E9HIM8_DAPPU|nr:hypothetical protein DAPPUDRAFT_330135 [Daphnia pulex]|eukprot:EFX68413.1 hypothetical protein DAPPUDRAFT_330135 [Daphnia pulex]